MKSPLFLIIVFLLFVSFTVNAQKRKTVAQSYTTALGVKFYPGAISLKHFIKPNTAVEGLGIFETEVVELQLY